MSTQRHVLVRAARLIEVKLDKDTDGQPVATHARVVPQDTTGIVEGDSELGDGFKTVRFEYPSATGYLKLDVPEKWLERV